MTTRRAFVKQKPHSVTRLPFKKRLALVTPVARDNRSLGRAVADVPVSWKMSLYLPRGGITSPESPDVVLVLIDVHWHEPVHIVILPRKKKSWYMQLRALQ